MNRGKRLVELIGWGAESSHNATNVFQSKRIITPTIEVQGRKVKTNTCNQCSKPVPSRRRLCEDCKEKNRREAQRKYRERQLKNKG